MTKKELAKKILAYMDDSKLRIIFDTSSLGRILFSVEGISTMCSLPSNSPILDGTKHLAYFITEIHGVNNAHCKQILKNELK